MGLRVRLAFASLNLKGIIYKFKDTLHNLQCGESVTIEGQAYTISAVTHRYQLRKGKYEPSEKRLDVLSTGRYLNNLDQYIYLVRSRKKLQIVAFTFFYFAIDAEMTPNIRL
ncbi:hypothetical protein CR513_07309, partial [Mucuna pruriens]